MTMIEIRKIIRNHAEAMGCAYRITAEDEVHFYGRMPNTNQTGWYLYGQGVAAVAQDIKAGRR